MRGIVLLARVQSCARGDDLACFNLFSRATWQVSDLSTHPSFQSSSLTPNSKKKKPINTYCNLRSSWALKQKILGPRSMIAIELILALPTRMEGGDGSMGGSEDGP